MDRFRKFCVKFFEFEGIDGGWKGGRLALTLRWWEE